MVVVVKEPKRAKSAGRRASESRGQFGIVFQVVLLFSKRYQGRLIIINGKDTFWACCNVNGKYGYIIDLINKK